MQTLVTPTKHIGFHEFMHGTSKCALTQVASKQTEPTDSHWGLQIKCKYSPENQDHKCFRLIYFVKVD